MIGQNRAAAMLMGLTLVVLAGCSGAEEAQTSVQAGELTEVLVAPTPEPVATTPAITMPTPELVEPTATAVVVAAPTPELVEPTATAVAVAASTPERVEPTATAVVVATPTPELAEPTATAVVVASTPEPAPPGCPAVDGSSAQQRAFDAPPPMCIDPAKTYLATMRTSMGDLTIALYPDIAPKTVNNFVVLARYRYYDGLIFHRVINGFVLQGGDPRGTGTGGPGYRFEDELPSAGQYEIGSLAMANAGPNTNGSQFFIISGPDGARLPPQYALFGKVVGGLELVPAMQAVPTGSGDRPVNDLIITSVTIAES